MNSVENIMKAVEENGVELIRFLYIDSDGVIRGYTTSAEQLEGDLKTGHNFAEAMPFFSVLDDLVPGSRFGCTGEISAVPDPDTFRVLPYVSNSAQMICDFVKKADHSNCGLCARTLLKEYLSGIEYEVRAAFENEFYLIVRDENGQWAPFDRSVCFATSGMNAQHEIVLDIVRALKAQGLTVEKYYPEYGPGQVEIVYKYSDALRTADNQVMFRETVKGTAQNHGVTASFMPKPFKDFAGSGAHFHISLFNEGKNLFYDASGPLNLSRTALHFLGGLRKHLRAVCAFTASTVNSYKRLIPHNWASAYNCYGPDNREAALRVVAGAKGAAEASFNIELKAVDGACNPYLAALAVLAAGMDGIENGIDPGEPVTTDPYDMSEEERESRGVRRLPKTLGEAVDALEADKLFERVLGKTFYEEYILLKRFAWDQYIRHVSDWEIDNYADKF